MPARMCVRRFTREICRAAGRIEAGTLGRGSPRRVFRRRSCSRPWRRRRWSPGQRQASAATRAHALAASAERKQNAGISATRSSTRPHWACPHRGLRSDRRAATVTGAGRAISPQGKLLRRQRRTRGLSPQDLESAYKIPLPRGSGQTVAVVDAFGYPTRRIRPGGIPLALRPAAVHESQRLLREAQPAGQGTRLPRRRTGAGTSSRRSTWTWSRPPARRATSCWWRRKTNRPIPNDLAESVNTAVNAGADEVSNSYGLPEEECRV